MSVPMDDTFIHYLAAKKTVDDRALNAGVWAALSAELNRSDNPSALSVLEIGAGIGTMVERTLERGLFSGNVHYLLVDEQPANLAEARHRLPVWAERHGWKAVWAGELLLVSSGRQTVKVQFAVEDALAFAAKGGFLADLLIAHAFLDLVHLPTALPILLSTLRPGGLFAFTLNFDGVTTFEPTIDSPLDAQIEALYHADMDGRIVNGKPSGDSHSGRHLLSLCCSMGADVLAAGSSDWVVFPVGGCYSADEAYFLHTIIGFVDKALRGHPNLDSNRFLRWVEARHTQVDMAELVYVAHQLDVLGRWFG